MNNYIIESIYDFYNENEYHNDMYKYGLDKYGAMDMRVMASPNGDYYDVTIQSRYDEASFELVPKEQIGNCVTNFIHKYL